MSVIVATAYMEEAERFDWLVAMDAGKRAGSRHAGGAQGADRQRDTLEEAFIALLAGAARAGHRNCVSSAAPAARRTSRSSRRGT